MNEMRGEESSRGRKRKKIDQKGREEEEERRGMKGIGKKRR
jgi:hypothetical protein